MKVFKDTLKHTMLQDHRADGAMQQKTASQLLGEDGCQATFRCPCPGCDDTFDMATPVSVFYKHLEHPKHWTYFDAHGIKCEFDCGRGFFDQCHRYIHYNTHSCVEVEKLGELKAYRCAQGSRPRDRCSTDEPKVFGRANFAMNHWERYHGAPAFNAYRSYKCTICKLGFIARQMFAAHFQKAYGRNEAYVNVHVTNLKSKGLLWNPDPSCIDRLSEGTSYPSYLQLLSAHMTAVADRKDHVILVFRQSFFQRGFRDVYLRKITSIAGTATRALAITKKVRIGSLAIVASHRTCSRLVPSRAADLQTEINLTQLSDFDEFGTSAKNRQIPNYCLTAARTTQNVTNQLLRAKVNGQRPILISMGTNGLSGN